MFYRRTDPQIREKVLIEKERVEMIKNVTGWETASGLNECETVLACVREMCGVCERRTVEKQSENMLFVHLGDHALAGHQSAKERWIMTQVSVHGERALSGIEHG